MTLAPSSTLTTEFHATLTPTDIAQERAGFPSSRNFNLSTATARNSNLSSLISAPFSAKEAEPAAAALSQQQFLKQFTHGARACVYGAVHESRETRSRRARQPGIRRFVDGGRRSAAQVRETGAAGGCQICVCTRTGATFWLV